MLSIERISTIREITEDIYTLTREECFSDCDDTEHCQTFMFNFEESKYLSCLEQMTSILETFDKNTFDIRRELKTTLQPSVFYPYSEITNKARFWNIHARFYKILLNQEIITNNYCVNSESSKLENQYQHLCQNYEYIWFIRQNTQIFPKDIISIIIKY